MSRGNPFDPVVTNFGGDQASRPNMVQTVSVSYEPAVRQQTGTQTSTPDLPPTG